MKSIANMTAQKKLRQIHVAASTEQQQIQSNANSYPCFNIFDTQSQICHLFASQTLGGNN